MAFTFGQPAQQQPLGLGTTGLSTGFGTTGGGATLGAPTAGSTPGGFTFGQPAQQPQQPSLFGAPAATATQPSMAGTPGGGLFGSPSTNQPKPLFGATPLATAQPASLFGGTVSTPATTTTTSLFGTTGGTAAAAPAFSFGTPAATTQPGLATSAFGVLSQPATTTAPPAFSFGGAPQTQPATTTAAAPSFGFGTALSTAATTTTTATVQPQAAAPLFAFGSAPTTSAAPSLTTSSTAPGTGLNFSFGTNLASTPTTSAAPTMTLGGVLGAPAAVPATQPGTFVGLGGVSNPNAISSSSLGYATGEGIGKSDTTNMGKGAVIPIELTQLVDELKQHMRTEKIYLAEISKRQEIPVEKVSQQIEELKNTLNNVTRLVQHQSHSYDTFVQDMAQVQKDLEMTIEFNETPPNLRRELIDTTPFYERLLERYTRQLKFYEREALRVIEVYRSGCDPEEVTAKELFATLQSTNDTVIALAAKVQNFHEKVGDEISSFRNLQRMTLGESKFVEEAPQIVSAVNDIYNRMYEKASVYFSPTIEASNVTKFLHNQPSPAKGATSPTALTSTPMFARQFGFQTNKHAEQSPFSSFTGGYGSPQALFQTQTSAILNSALQSPTGQSNTSLKRSKR